MSQQPKSPKSRFPRKTIVVTLFLAIAVGVAQFMMGTLHDTMRIDPSVVNLLSMLVSFLIVVLWAIWFAFFATRSRILGLVLGAACLSLPLVFHYLTSPVWDGDMGIARFDFRLFRSGSTPPPSVADPKLPPTTIDLSNLSPLDFPEFLGPNRTSTVQSIKLDPDWAKQEPQIVWKQPVGKGWSGVSVVNGFAFTMEQLGADECVTCYSIEDGKLLWRYSNPQRHEDMPGMGKAGPRATPTIYNAKVYAQGAAGMLSCLDGATGELLWKHDLCELLKIERSERTDSEGFTYLEEKSPLAWGRSASPLVVGQLVYVPGGGPTDGPFSTLLAFDKDSGELAWKSGDQMISYGSPSFATVAGKPQVLLVAEKTAMGFDPTSGKVLWSFSRPGTSNASANCSQVTVASDNHVLLTKGYGLGGELLALEDNGSGIEVDSLWKSSRVLTTKFSNPVILDGYVYALADGFLECVNLKDGKMAWNLRERFGHGQLLLVGDLLLVQSESGRLRLYPAKPGKPTVLGDFQTINGVCWNTLCLSGDRLIVRSDLEMACVRLPVLSQKENSK